MARMVDLRDDMSTTQSVLEKETTNAGLPVNRLPTEILVYIFQEFQRAIVSSSSSLSWVQLTWVCHHWRVTAISSPILWTTIAIYKGSKDMVWLPTFLERAAGALLDVTVFPPQDCEAVLQTLLPYAPTFRRLFVWAVPSTPSLSILLTPFLTNICAIEDLVLAGDPSNNEHVVLPDLSRQHFPRLRSLDVSVIHFPWTSSVYSSLRSLGLTAIERIPTAHEFLRILEACPELEELTIERTGSGSHILDLGIRPDENVMLFRPSPIDLPKLRKLQLESSITDAKFICNHISAPPTCAVNISYIVPEPDQGTVDLISIVIPRDTLFQPLLSRYTTFSLYMGQPHVRLWMCDGLSTGHYVWNIVDNSNFNAPVITPALWREMLHSISASPLTRIDIAFDPLPLISTDMWRACFSTFPLIEDLAVGPSRSFGGGGLATLRNMFAALESASSTPLQVNVEGLPCPRLRVLGVTLILIDNALADALLSLLEIRASRGAPRLHLSFKRTYCTKDVDVIVLKGRLEKFAAVTVEYIAFHACDEYDYCDTFRHKADLQAPET